MLTEIGFVWSESVFAQQGALARSSVHVLQGSAEQFLRLYF